MIIIYGIMIAILIVLIYFIYKAIKSNKEPKEIIYCKDCAYWRDKCVFVKKFKVMDNITGIEKEIKKDAIDIVKEKEIHYYSTQPPHEILNNNNDCEYYKNKDKYNVKFK